MSARKGVKRRASKGAATRTRPPQPGQGNPSWGRSFVTASRRQNWKPTPALERENAPLSLSAGPGAEGDRIDVSIRESLFAEPEDSSRFGLEIDVYNPMKGRQRISTYVSLEQLYSLEEAVRAVFRAAREEGIIPIKSERLA